MRLPPGILTPSETYEWPEVEVPPLAANARNGWTLLHRARRSVNARASRRRAATGAAASEEDRPLIHSQRGRGVDRYRPPSGKEAGHDSTRGGPRRPVTASRPGGPTWRIDDGERTHTNYEGTHELSTRCL